MAGVVIAVVVAVVLFWRKSKTAGIIAAAVAGVAGIIYIIVYSLVQNLMIGIDQDNIQVENPVASGDLSNGEMKGVIPLVITNPTPYGFGISSIYATVTDPDGNVLATINAPFSFDVIANGTTSVPLAFTAQVETAVVSAITQLIGKSVGETLSGRVYFLNGIAWKTFTQNVNLKI